MMIYFDKIGKVGVMRYVKLCIRLYEGDMR